jgi:S1-C subfamily serine protease
MSIDVGTEARAFCTTCGARLDNGRCPTSHVPVARDESRDARPPAKRAGSRLTRVGPIAGVVGLVVTLVRVGALLVPVNALNGRVQRLLDSETAARATTSALDKRLDAINAAANGVATRVGALEAKAKTAPNPAAVAKKVRASVFVIETDFGQGSAWAVTSSGGSTTLVTNFHVVSDTWTRGGRTVQVKQNDGTWTGTIERVDIPDDLALISAPQSFPVLDRATKAPEIGDSVMVVGAPLGLDATVTSGIVSARRTEEGHAYLQFSAPISPGNSGGPVVDNRGQVVGVAVSKYVGNDAEGLSFAVPVDKLCSGLSIC